MQGSSGTRGGLVHLLAGAALGAAIVLVIWIFSGGRPFGEIVGTGEVSAPTPAVVEKTPIQQRTDVPAATRAQLEKAPPSLGGGSGQLRFKKPAATRSAKAERAAKAKRKTRRARRKAVVRVTAPPPAQPAEQLPVAVVPSPAPAAAPAPPAPAPSGGAGKPVKRRAPALSVGAGEG